MALLHSLFVILIIAQVYKECYSLSANISNDLNKKFEELGKQISLEIKKIQKQNQYLQKEIQLLQHRTNINFEYCKLQPDDVCGPCLCKDDARVFKKYYSDCQNLQAKRDCLEHKQVGVKVNGVYKIHQNILKIIQVYCDQTTDGGGWTVFQRRTDGSVDFLRDWERYKQGFGNLQNEFWLGNENIFTLTLQGLYAQGNELRIDMMNAKKIKKSVRYANFHITNAATKYTLFVNGYIGTLADALKRHNRKKFTTFDSDNDPHPTLNCASHLFGAWWFDNCHASHLNGKYFSGGKMSIDRSDRIILIHTGIHWYSNGFNGPSDSLIFTEMKLRRKL